MRHIVNNRKKGEINPYLLTMQVHQTNKDWKRYEVAETAECDVVMDEKVKKTIKSIIPENIESLFDSSKDTIRHILSRELTSHLYEFEELEDNLNLLAKAFVTVLVE